MIAEEPMPLHRLLPGFIVLALLTFVAPAATPARAAQGSLPCDVESLPQDDLASAAFGLTRQELDTLYGPGEAIQSGWYYDFGDFGLTLANCDLILDIAPDGQFADPDAAHELVRTLLPEDVVLAADAAFGTIQSVPQDVEEWVSAALAARYRLLGEPLTGAVLVLYTYDGDAYNPGSVALIELRAAQIPG
jgi:hypothetical protein